MPRQTSRCCRVSCLTHYLSHHRRPPSATQVLPVEDECIVLELIAAEKSPVAGPMATPR